MIARSFEEAVVQVEVGGFAVLPDLLTAAECEEARRELDRILAEEAALPDAPGSAHRKNAFNLFNKARVFERLYQLPPLLRVIRHFLGEDAVLSAVQAHVVMPGAPAQSLHYDGGLTGPFRPGSTGAADAAQRIVSHVLGFNVVFCITDFTREQGPTRVVPGSHRHPGCDVYRDGPAPNEVLVEAPRGSALIFNIATWHGSSPHYGTEPRYAIMTPWRRSWIRPEVDLTRMVAPEVLERAGPDGPVIFGFQARPPYTERWQWDASTGRPKPAWKHLERDDPRP